MRFLPLPLIFAWLAVATPAGRAVAAGTAPRPNILLILIDDLNDWIGAMDGHPNARTPHLDRLAARGTLFTNAHAAAPLCGPARAALLSGLRPSTTGIYGHNNLATLRRNTIIGGLPLLPEYFADHGYKTLATGKVFHEGSPAAAFGAVGVRTTDFGPSPPQRLAYTPPEGGGTLTDWGAFPAADEAMPDHRSARWAAERLQEHHDRPFLLCVGFVRPHVPWTVPQAWFDLHPLETIVRPPFRADDLDDLPQTARRFSELPMMPSVEWMKQEQRWEKSVQAYHASVTFVDHQVGVVLAALEQSPHAADTIIVLLSDHGYHLGEKGIWAKHTLWERSTRIPMIIARPGDDTGRRTRRPANHVDVFPTLIDLAGLPPVARHDGKSLAPLLDDPEAGGYHASITTHGYGNHSVRTERWRYIRYDDGAEELYDHAEDPNEWHNLASQSRHADTIRELRAHLPAVNAPWMAETKAGSHYNDYLGQLYQRTRDDRQESAR